MTEMSTRKVLELARERIMQRREDEQLQQEQVYQEQHDRDRPWRLAFLLSLGGVVLALLLTPGVPLDEKMYAVLHGLCSQEHNIILGGIQFPICARCSGIYISMLNTMLVVWLLGRGRAGRIPPLPILAVLVLFVVLMGIDGVNSMAEGMALPWHFYQSYNVVRTITGLGMGVAIGLLIILMFNLSLRRNTNHEQPVLATWRELGIILALNFLVLVAIYGNLELLAWPLAFMAFFGMISVIYMVSLILVSLLMGYDDTVTSLTQLARPATLAFIPTLVLIAAFTLLRYWLEAQMSVISG
ncbi:MAG: DUF2085 domain-containing protein [Chloroflexaceae bacterium]|nr:DUF2085 domain-containing protein [Chloroflexaceae bacterium]